MVLVRDFFLEIMGDLNMKTKKSIQIDTESYNQAKEIIKTLGLSYSQAINIFNNLIILYKGLSFAKIPNDKTIKEAESTYGDIELEEFDNSISLTNIMKEFSKGEYSKDFLKDLEEGFRTSTIYSEEK